MAQKAGASMEDYRRLCDLITREIDVPINFEGYYKWIAFLPSRLHPHVSVLNRYLGVMDSGKIKVRGLEVRRRDTPHYIFDAQTEMINTLAKADNTPELYRQIPEALKVLRTYRQRLLAGEIPLSDLIVTKHMSKQPKTLSPASQPSHSSPTTIPPWIGFACRQQRTVPVHRRQPQTRQP